MRPVKNLDDAVFPMYMASIAIRVELTGNPIKRPLLKGFGFDRVLARFLTLSNPSYLQLQRTEVHRV